MDDATSEQPKKPKKSGEPEVTTLAQINEDAKLPQKVVSDRSASVIDKVTIDNPSADIRLGQYILIAFFVVFLGWAAIVRVDAAVYAGGSVAIAGNRQQVQHREGGVVAKLNVKEGDVVAKDQVLVELSGGQPQANADAFRAEFITLRVQQARLLAEASGLGGFSEPIEFKSYAGNDRALVDQAMFIQRKAMSARRQSTSAQVSVLHQQQIQTQQTMSGNRAQLAANQKRKSLAEEELTGVESLEAKGFASKSRVRSIQQGIAGLEGENAGLSSEITRGNSVIGESRMRELAIRRQNQQDIIAELRQTQGKLSEIIPQMTAAQSEFGRTFLRAPATGRVVGLTVFTVGGVIAPGQKVLDIVPDNAPLIIEANIEAKDGDDVRIGQEANVQYSALHERDLPVMKGRVLQFSADAFQDQNSGRIYYKAQIEISAQSIKKINALRGETDVLKPGLPVEVVIPLRKRTVLDYLLEPLSHTLWRSFREH